MISICFVAVGVLTVFNNILIDSIKNGCLNVKLMVIIFYQHYIFLAL